MYNDNSSDQSSSSEEDELEILHLDLAVAPKRMHGPCINLQDISDFDCEWIFRCFHVMDEMITRNFMHAYRILFHRFQKSDIEHLGIALNLPKT